MAIFCDEKFDFYGNGEFDESLEFEMVLLEDFDIEFLD